MDATAAVDLARQGVMLMLVVAAPMLLSSMGVGLVISILQAVTQVQEQTLSFVPKIVVMLIVAVLTAPWAMAKVVEFSRAMFGTLP